MRTAYERPASIEAACAILAQAGGAARPIAGCTAVPPSELGADPSVAVLVDLTAIDSLARIEGTQGGLRIGATVSAADLAASSAVIERAPLLARAAAGIGDEVLRQVATIGGNVAPRVPRPLELPIAMVALEAEIEIASAQGSRRVPATALADREFALAADDVIVAFELPASGGRWAYRKLTTNLGSYGVACLAISCPAERPPIAVAGLGESIPQELRNVGAALAASEPLDSASVAAAACEGLSAVDDALASAAYRKRALRAVLERELAVLADGSGKGGG